MVTSFGPGKWQNELLDCVSWCLLTVECGLAPTNAAFGRFTVANLGLSAIAIGVAITRLAMISSLIWSLLLTSL
mgnify:CR=1 FL=1